MTALTLADISDLRAYERERPEFLRQVIELKKVRRVPVGPFVTVVFENRTTIRFQIQEMVRAETMTTDEQVQGELDIYNPLVPGPGEICLTLFIELTSEADLRAWLPRLVGIERSVELHIGDDPVTTLAATVDPAHAVQLTREDVTASVHYLRFALDAGQRSRLEAGPVALAITHEAYTHAAVLSDETRRSLLDDWDA